MMATMMATVEKWEDQAFTQVKQAEPPVLRFTEDMSERLARFVPERPAFMADLPKLTEVIESQLKFGKKVVDEQFRFTRKMVKAMDPMMTKFDAERVAKPVRQAPVTKVTPRRSGRSAA